MDERKVAFDTLAAANDNMAIGAIHELKHRNIAVPEADCHRGF